MERIGFLKGFSTVDHHHQTIKANYSKDRGILSAPLPIVCRLREDLRHHRDLGYPGIHAELPGQLSIYPRAEMSLQNRYDDRLSTRTEHNTSSIAS